LPEILGAMGCHLTYWWIFAVQIPGNPCAIHSRRIQNHWKPVVAFSRPPLRTAPDWLVDSIERTRADRTYHEWGKDWSEAAYLIQRLTEPGALVVDAYCGGGQIPAACKGTGRRWLATELDRRTVVIARKRLAEMK
jgi:hypothetical protein